MKYIKSAFALPLLFLFTNNTMALDIPQDQNIVSLQSTPGLMEGIVKISNPSSTGDISYLPVDVFSHVQFTWAYPWVPRGFTPDFANGLANAPFVMITNQGNDYNESVARVCYKQEIPVNALLVLKKYGDYLVRPIDIPENRLNRKCMDVPYLTRDEFTVGTGVVEFVSDFMVIIDKDYQDFPFDSYAPW